MTLYEEVGGAPTFEALVHAFYEGVAADPQLRALYPEDDLAPAERRLRMFLTQYFGGPTTYSEERGHPRLRMRHAPFPVTLDMRDRWMRHMLAAMDTLDLPEAQDEQMRDYFLRAAHMLVNTDETHPRRLAAAPAARGLSATTRGAFRERHGIRKHGAGDPADH